MKTYIHTLHVLSHRVKRSIPLAALLAHIFRLSITLHKRRKKIWHFANAMMVRYTYIAGTCLIQIEKKNITRNYSALRVILQRSASFDASQTPLLPCLRRRIAKQRRCIFPIASYAPYKLFYVFTQVKSIGNVLYSKLTTFLQPLLN